MFIRLSDLFNNCVKLGLNGKNTWLLSDQDVSTFWLGQPKCTETDIKKSQICPILGESDKIWMPSLTSLPDPVVVYNLFSAIFSARYYLLLLSTFAIAFLCWRNCYYFFLYWIWLYFYFWCKYLWLSFSSVYHCENNSADIKKNIFIAIFCLSFYFIHLVNLVQSCGCEMLFKIMVSISKFYLRTFLITNGIVNILSNSNKYSNMDNLSVLYKIVAIIK